jgi:hypothetical protein
VSLVDLRATPIVRVTERGIETAGDEGDGEQPFDIIVWATGFDFGTGALARMGIRGRDGLALEGRCDDDRRFRIQDRDGTFPRMDAGRLRGCSDAGYRLYGDRAKSGRIRVILAGFCFGLSADRRCSGFDAAPRNLDRSALSVGDPYDGHRQRRCHNAE